jgi:ribonuclease-3
MSDSAKSEQTIAAVERILGHSFSDKSLVVEALTHPSLGTNGSYQRLEFLGDRVVGLVMAEKIFTAHPEDAEGKLNRRFASLVRRETLGEVAKDLGLPGYIRMTETVERGNGRENFSILSDVLEALIGALYLDGGFEAAEAFIQRAWEPHMSIKSAQKDPKSALQEWAQGRGLPLPEYKVVSSSGPDHAPKFAVEVSVEGNGAEVGKGTSKKEAETAAAKALLKKLISEEGK